MLADINEGTATLATLFEVHAALIHLGEFLSHEANDFHAEQGLGTKEFLECRGFCKAEGAIALAYSGKGVGLRAQGSGYTNCGTGAENPLKDFFATFDCHRNANQSGADDVDTPTGIALLYRNFTLRELQNGADRG